VATYFDDIGKGYRSLVGRARVPVSEAIAFAERWDPQPFHVDEAAAKESIYGGLTLSSLHLFAICTRLFFDHEDRIAVLAMLGKDEIRFPNPARPDEELSYHTECIEAKASNSKPDRGVIELKDTVTNEAGETVMSQRVTLMVARRKAR
jgi:acyl dehydratase